MAQFRSVYIRAPYRGGLPICVTVTVHLVLVRLVAFNVPAGGVFSVWLFVTRLSQNLQLQWTAKKNQPTQRTTKQNYQTNARNIIGRIATPGKQRCWALFSW